MNLYRFTSFTGYYGWLWDTKYLKLLSENIRAAMLFINSILGVVYMERRILEHTRQYVSNLWNVVNSINGLSSICTPTPNPSLYECWQREDVIVGQLQLFLLKQGNRLSFFKLCWTIWSPQIVLFSTVIFLLSLSSFIAQCFCENILHSNGLSNRSYFLPGKISSNTQCRWTNQLNYLPY